MAAVAHAPRVATEAELAGEGRIENYFSASYVARWSDGQVVRDTFVAHMFCTDEQLYQVAQRSFEEDYESDGAHLISVDWTEG